MTIGSIQSKSDLPKDPGKLRDFAWEIILRYHQLQERLVLLNKQQFGQRSEKSTDLDAVQEEMADLLSQLESAPVAKEETVEVITITKHTRNKRHPGRNVIPENIEREVIVHDIPEDEKICKCCNRPKSQLRPKEHTVIKRVPAQYKAVVHVRPVYVCSHCKDEVSVAEPALLPIPKGIGDIDLICFVILSKYRYHLPLYRIQRQIFHESGGIWLTRSTMVSWLRYLFKSVKRLHYELLAEYKHCLIKHADESPIKVRQEGLKGRHHEGRMWVGAGFDEYQGPVVAVFHYDESRSAKAAEQFLKGSAPGDVVMIDGCASYAKPIEKYGLIELNCMAHARRKFTDALECGYKADYCHKILRKFAQLYRIERFAQDASCQKRFELRQRFSKAILADIKELLLKPGFEIAPARKIGQAINYMLNRWVLLNRYLENGLYPIDNNPVERIIRTLAIGRKNWMCAGSENGANWCAAFYSLIATCLLNGIDPEEYLRDVLMRMAIRPPEAQVMDLLPVAWANEKYPQGTKKLVYPKN